MNWTTLKAAPVTIAALANPKQAQDNTATVKALRAAALYYDNLRSDFCVGKGDTCRDLAAKLERYGAFASDKQAGFAAKLIDWAQPKAPVAEKANQQATGVFPVLKLFAVLQRHSTFHAGNLKLSRKNQDTLVWIVFADVVVGKLEDGNAMIWGKRAYAAGTTGEFVAALIREFEDDPLAAAIKYGKLSGRCCSCGRNLTDPVSIERGIGPQCILKF